MVLYYGGNVYRFMLQYDQIQLSSFRTLLCIFDDVKIEILLHIAVLMRI